jgi:hypothetical protein
MDRQKDKSSSLHIISIYYQIKYKNLCPSCGFFRKKRNKNNKNCIFSIKVTNIKTSYLLQENPKIIY